MRTNALYRILIFVCAAALLLSGCSDDEEARKKAQLDEARNSCTAEIEELRVKLLSDMPQQYTVSLGEDAGSSASGDAVGTTLFDGVVTCQQIEEACESEKLDMLRPVAVSILRERLECVKTVADDNSVTLVQQAAIEIELQIKSAQTVSDLYNCLLSAESKLIAPIEIELSGDLKDKARAGYQIYVDGSGETWLCINTNFVLPGFKDDATGFSLQLLLDNGKKAYAAADSLYNHENIVFDGAYSVRFNITRMLGTMTANDFFAGRNRIVFSVFAVDNSICFSQDFYRIPTRDTVFCSSAESLLKLICICAQYS